MRPSKTPPGCTCFSAEWVPSATTTSTLEAAGRNVRITTPEPLSGWAPRYPCGFACWRETSWSASLIVDSLRFQEPQDPCDRDRDPVGSVVQLVSQLVDGLLQLEDGQQLLGGLLARRQQAVVHGPVVPSQEAFTRAVLPAVRRLVPAQELAASGGVGERAQHAGH